jgi:guanylate kinase
MSQKHTLLIIGPTAVGKSTLLGRALLDYPVLCDIITYTTRDPRAGEKDGDPYHFVSEAKFRELMNDGFFIETANVHGKLYGTPRDQFELAHATGRVVIMDIDVQGAKKLLEVYPEAMTVFVQPPTMDALRQRFVKRGVTSEKDLENRLVSAQKEMAQAQDFKKTIINDDFEAAYIELRKVIENILKFQ